MSKRLTQMLLLCVAVFCGCARESGPVEAPAPTTVDLNEKVIIESCNAVQDAAEEYADRHGEYPGGMDSDITVDIQTCVVPELTDGRLPGGPVTEWIEIPRGTERINPEAIDYTIIQYGFWNLGYIVRGYVSGGLVVTLTSGEPREETVVRLNCLHLRAAVEEFAVRNGGEYPANADTDRTPCGNTAIDLLPRGHLCRNPYNGEETVPVNRTPVTPGEIGYTAINEFYTYRGILVRGRRVGYVISGHGVEEIVCVLNNRDYSSKNALVIQNCLTIERAARTFALNNAGSYPRNVGCDIDAAGNTLIDYLPNGCRLRNPYTGIKTEPIDCVAANPGESGFVTRYCGGLMGYCGYCITGTGTNGNVICTLAEGPPETDGH